MIDELVRVLMSDKYEDLIAFNRNFDIPMPSIVDLKRFVELMREVLFPGYYVSFANHKEKLEDYLLKQLTEAKIILKEQVLLGFCYNCHNASKMRCKKCRDRVNNVVETFLKFIPTLRERLATHVKAAYDGDPAAISHSETIFCYPSIRALTNYEIANVLYRLDVPLVPRIISEFAHSETGIDIHPGASIGKYCFIDHGTGVVIGETAIIGEHVRIYQGVTLGAISIKVDEKTGRVKKGEPRHPIVEDGVIIYSGATILGRITIGKNSIIGGNAWITQDIPANSKVYKK